jgi:predicted NBD/HSP70 family sugar kinase
MQKTGNKKLIQELNRSIILKTIRNHGPISRSEIAKKYKFSPTTVTAAVRILLQQGLVFEEGLGMSSGGKKPILVRFSPESRCIFGVDINYTSIRIAEMNLEAEIRKQKIFPFNNLIGKSLIDYILNAIGQFLGEYSDLSNCIGISIIFPGIINIDEGIIYESTKLKIKNIPLKELLEKRFKLKVWLENDAKAIAIAEKQFGQYKKYKNLVYITIGDGVGAGIIMNGTLFRGCSGGSGEFGHTSIDMNGIYCDCGNRGCIERYINWPAIYSKIIFFIQQEKHTAILDLAKGDINQITPAIYLEALKKEDQLAEEITREIAKYLSIGIVNLVHLLNPDIIILGGKVARENYYLCSKVKEFVFKQALTVSTNKLGIYLTSFKKDFIMVAAASVALHDEFHFSLSI